MVTGSAAVALMIQMVPYVIAMKLVGGIIDLTVHYLKGRIEKRSKLMKEDK